MPFLFYGVLGYTLFATRGVYSAWAVASLAVGFFLCAASMVRPFGVKPFAFEKSISRERLFSGVILFFSALLLRDHGLIYHTQSGGYLLRGILLGVFLLMGARVFVPRFLPRFIQNEIYLDLTALIALFGVQCLSLRVSPQPTIDVFTITTEALDFLLRGMNPYVQTYTDVYQGKYGYRASPNYWPGFFYCLTPFRWLFGDFRWGYVAANLLTAVSIYQVTVKAHSSSPAKAPALGIRNVLFWFLFPVTFFVLEQAWADFLLICISGWIAFGLQRQRWIFCGLLAGLLLGVKQYGVGVVWITGLFIALSAGRSQALKFFACAVASFLACVLPFALWDWKAFYENTVQLYLEQPFREDAMVVKNLLIQEWGMTPPSSLFLVPVIAGVGGVIPIWMKRTRALQLSHWAAALTLSYGLIFLFVKNAFCNYYYFLAFFVFLYLIGSDFPVKITGKRGKK